MVEHRSLGNASRAGGVYHVGQAVWCGKVNGVCHLAEVHVIDKDDLHPFRQVYPL